MGIRKAWWGRRGWVRAAPRLASAGNWRGRRDDDSCLFRLTSRASRDTLTRRGSGSVEGWLLAAPCPGKSGHLTRVAPLRLHARGLHTHSAGRDPAKDELSCRDGTYAMRTHRRGSGGGKPRVFPRGIRGMGEGAVGVGVSRGQATRRATSAEDGGKRGRGDTYSLCHCVCWCCVGNRGV